MPTIREHMTTSPHTIGDEQPIHDAIRKMRLLHVRHLPVLHGGRLVGILSDRDLRLVESARGAEELTVGEAMSTEVFSVAADEELGSVVARMAAEKIGSAVVLARNEVVGIFTTTDALGLLSRLLVLEELRGVGF